MIRSIDLTYRKHDYRIREDIREQGAEIHRGGSVVPCAGCCKSVAASTPRLLEPGVGPQCLICALQLGLLVETPESIAREADAAGQRAIRGEPAAAVGR